MIKRFGLAIHSSSAQLGLGLLDSDGSIKMQVWDLDRSLSSHLHQCLKDFLQGIDWQELAYITVARGPGSFTSIRIGMVTARILAQELSIPLFAISSLASLAQTQRVYLDQDQFIATQLTATSDKYYVAIYEKLSQSKIVSPIFEDTILEMQQWEKTLAQLIKPYHLIEEERQLGYAVDGLLQLANALYCQGQMPQWSEGLPVYLSSVKIDN